MGTPAAVVARSLGGDLQDFSHGHGWARTGDLSRVKRYRSLLK